MVTYTAKKEKDHNLKEHQVIIILAQKILILLRILGHRVRKGLDKQRVFVRDMKLQNQGKTKQVRKTGRRVGSDDEVDGEANEQDRRQRFRDEGSKIAINKFHIIWLDVQLVCTVAIMYPLQFFLCNSFVISNLGSITSLKKRQSGFRACPHPSIINVECQILTVSGLYI